MKINPDFITEADEKEIGFHVDAALDGIRQNKRRGRNRILRMGWDYENPVKWLRYIPEGFCHDVLFWYDGRSGGDDPLDWIPDSLTINEYVRGQSISPHIDSPAFGDVAILSLLADATMRFTSPAGETRDFVLPRRSLAIMSGELRSKWEHSTLPLVGERRISLVYRKRL